MTIRTKLLEPAISSATRSSTQIPRRYAKEVVAGTGRASSRPSCRARRAHRRMAFRYRSSPISRRAKAAMRDLHALFWIAKYLYGSMTSRRWSSVASSPPRRGRDFDKAEAFCGRCGVGLHDLAGRPEERLASDLPPAGAGAALGYTDHAGTRGVER